MHNSKGLVEKEHEAFSPVAAYLTEMATACPHALFQEEHRASQAAKAFDLAGVEIVEKQNLAPRIAHLALQAVTHNKRRHDELQRFMLTTDSVTVAVEVPIYLTPADISEFIPIMVCWASHERRHHRWPVYGSPMCRRALRSFWI
jgi:hypothetical protein